MKKILSLFPTDFASHSFQRKSSKKPQNGFTIVEMMLYMALMTILLVILTEIFTSIISVRLNADANSAVDQDTRFILARLNYDIQRSSAVSTPASLGQTSGSLALTISGSTYTYSLSNGVLSLTTPSGASQLTSSETSISQLSFQKIGNTGGKETVQVLMTIKSKAITPAQAQQRSIQTTLGRR